MNNTEIYIGKNTPVNKELLWLRPLNPGVSLYGNVNGKWEPLKLIDGKGTRTVEDDEVVNVAGGYTKEEIDERFADILGLDAAGISELKALIEDEDSLTGLLSEINNKYDKADDVIISDSKIDITNSNYTLTRIEPNRIELVEGTESGTSGSGGGFYMNNSTMYVGDIRGTYKIATHNDLEDYVKTSENSVVFDKAYPEGGLSHDFSIARNTWTYNSSLDIYEASNNSSGKKEGKFNILSDYKKEVEIILHDVPAGEFELQDLSFNNYIYVGTLQAQTDLLIVITFNEATQKRHYKICNYANPTTVLYDADDNSGNVGGIFGFRATGTFNIHLNELTYYKIVSEYIAPSNIGTITGITMNNVSKGTSGVVDLGTVLTSTTSSVTSGSNDPVTSGAVYTALQGYETKLAFTTESNTGYVASKNTYHRHTNTPSSLAITLPASPTSGDVCVFNFTTSNSFASTGFSISGNGHTVTKMKDFEISNSKTYELIALYNGSVWLLTYTEFQ